MRFVIIMAVAGTLGVACPSPTPPPSGPRTTAKPRPKPRARTSSKAGLAESQRKYAKVRAGLKAAIKKKGFPLVQKLLSGYSVIVSQDCRGQLRTDLGLLEVPLATKKLFGTGLQRGLVVAVVKTPKAPDPSNFDYTLPPPGKMTARDLRLCGVTVGRVTPKNPFTVLVEAIADPDNVPQKLSATWHQFPKGKVLVEIAMELPIDTGRHGNAKETSTQATLFGYTDGVFRKLMSYTRQSGSSDASENVTQTVTLKFVRQAPPREHLVIRVKRLERMAFQASPNPDAPTGPETSWTENYSVYELFPKRHTIRQVKGAALKRLLKRSALAPYRMPKTGGD